MVYKTFIMKIFTCIACCFLLIISGCGKDKDDDRVIKIEGYHLFDANGMETGMVGGQDRDWTIVGLTSKELALFEIMKASDQVLVNTKECDISLIKCYPSPASSNQTFSVVSSDTVVVNLAIVDDQMIPVVSIVGRGKGQLNFNFSLQDIPSKNANTSYRLYYSFSAAGKPNFKAGYGDIRICDNLTDCFK
jgi:hypothetical protein